MPVEKKMNWLQRKAPGNREGTVGAAEMLSVGGGQSLAFTKRSRRLYYIKQSLFRKLISQSVLQ